MVEVILGVVVLAAGGYALYNHVTLKQVEAEVTLLEAKFANAEALAKADVSKVVSDVKAFLATVKAKL